jgi:hypothetical protein
VWIAKNYHSGRLQQFTVIVTTAVDATPLPSRYLQLFQFFYSTTMVDSLNIYDNAVSFQAEMMNSQTNSSAPAWMVEFVNFRKRLFMQTVEPIIVALLGPVSSEDETILGFPDSSTMDIRHNGTKWHIDGQHRRLSFEFDFIPNYVEDPYSYRETSMSFATLVMLIMLMSCTLVIFLACFYHSQKTSPLFISPRRHRLPRLVPPPLPVDGYFDWVSFDSMRKKCE